MLLNLLNALNVTKPTKLLDKTTFNTAYMYEVSSLTKGHNS